MTQYVNLKEEAPLNAIYKAKEDYLNSTNQNGNKVPFTYEEIQAVKNNDQSFLDFLDTSIRNKGKAAGDVSLEAKINTLYVADSAKIDLQLKMERQNERLKNYLLTTGEVPAKNIAIKTADAAKLDAYEKKAIYKIEMSLPGAEGPEE